ncbi:MAG: GNAT family N-acetyltransferase [Candidatus Thorarchaeota archaeon]
MKIVKMTKKHLPELAIVLADAFDNWRIQSKGETDRKLRKPETMNPFIELEPEGCFIALEERKVIGGIFSHEWGKMGWIGTFGVSPEYQKKGYGKQLLYQAIEYLDKKRNVTKLALETMANSKENIALYSKMGFRPAFQTISLEKQILISDKEKKRINELMLKYNLETTFYSEETNKQDILNRCKWISGKIENGLDYSSEIELAYKNKFGDTILVKRDGFVIAFAYCRTISIHQDIDSPDLFVKILVIDVDQKEKEILELILLTASNFGFENNKTNIRINVNSSYWSVYKYLLDNNYRIRSTLLRMIKFSEEIRAFDNIHDWIVNCSGLTM